MASVTYPKVPAFKPETIITNMPRASKSTGAPLLKKKKRKKKITAGQKKVEEYLKENPQKKKRGDSEFW